MMFGEISTAGDALTTLLLFTEEVFPGVFWLLRLTTLEPTVLEDHLSDRIS